MENSFKTPHQKKINKKMLKVNISGPMAVGKTTAIKELIRINLNYTAILENTVINNELFKSICTREESLFSIDFKQIIYINDFLERSSKVSNDVIIFDKGIEDILFFWEQSLKLDYKNKINQSLLWQMKENMKDNFSDICIYLDASDEILLSRKLHDESRSRNFFDTYMFNYKNSEKEYFLKNNAIFINTNEMNKHDIILTLDSIIKSF